MTNRGLSISLRLQPLSLPKPLMVGILDCHLEFETSQRLGILLERMNTGTNQFSRIQCGNLLNGNVIGCSPPSQLFVRQNPYNQDQGPLAHVLLLRNFHCHTHPYTVESTFYLRSSDAVDPTQTLSLKKDPRGTTEARSWVPTPYLTVFRIPQKPGVAVLALELFRKMNEKRLFVLVGTAADSRLAFSIVESEAELKLRQEHFGAYARHAETPQRFHISGVGAGDCLLKATIQSHVESGHRTSAVDLEITDLFRHKDTVGKVDEGQMQGHAQSRERHSHRLFSWFSRSG